MSERFLTAGLPGTGGALRRRPEDFVVEEIPLYEPSGAGVHLYLHIQKVGISTHEAVHRIARALGVPKAAVGHAGLKDARAIARQTISVSGAKERDAAKIEDPAITVLGARRHRNKLRPGHLAGNRFFIRVRDVDEGAAETAEEILDLLAARGVPNLFGPQRFGSKGDGHRVGRALLLSDPDAAVAALLTDAGPIEETGRVREARDLLGRGDLAGALRAFPASYRTERRVLGALIEGKSNATAIRRIPKNVKRLLVSAYQSSLFNELLLDRLPELGRLEEGDLAWLHDRGAVFTVTDPAAEQPRADRLEISPSGPLFGRKVKLAEGEPGRRERDLLAREGLSRADFSSPGLRMDGERRPLRVPVRDPSVRPDGEGAILVSFSLPSGSFATSVLREIMK